MPICRNQIILILTGLVYFLVLMNAPLITFGIKYGYLAMFLVLIVFLFFGRLSKVTLRKFSLHLLYVVVMAVSLCITVIFLEGENNSFVSFGLYTLPLIVWIAFYTNKNRITFSTIFVSTYSLTVVVAYLGIIQYFFSPNLFGYIPTNSMSIQWAVDKSFAEYSIFFRATSTLGSPQVFGLFCALNLLLTLRYKRDLSFYSFYIGLIGLFVGGALTGNKSFFLILFLYLLLSNFRKLFTNFKFISLLLVFVSLSVINHELIVKNVPMLERVFSFTEIIEQESSGSESRLGRYEYILTNSNPFVGEGLGTITNTSTKELKAAESYFLKIYYEAGAFAMVLFLVLCLLSYFQALKVDNRDANIVAMTMLGMAVVHAFESPSFFIVWGHFLGSVVIAMLRSKKEYEY